MLMLTSGRVRFDGVPWTHTRSVRIDRAAERTIVEHADTGPHITFADVPAVRVSITIVQEIESDDLAPPAPADEGILLIEAPPSGSDLGGRRVRCRALVTSVRYDLASAKPATRTIELIALSTSPATDPITIELI